MDIRRVRNLMETISNDHQACASFRWILSLFFSIEIIKYSKPLLDHVTIDKTK